MSISASSLFPTQVCFVVDDVAATAQECGRRFGWGPFETFTATVDAARYKGSVARRVTDVALGMAGAVQVELIHVHEGLDCVATYQHRYGRGFQHLGIYCRSRDAAIERLEPLGAVVDDLNEFTGIKIGFMDVPTGPAMFELLQPTSEDAGPAGDPLPHEPAPNTELLEVDRATIVTSDMQATLSFYAQAFDWNGVSASTQTLRHGESETRLDRAIGRAGLMQLELIGGTPDGLDPYSRHLARGDHGLVHASAEVRQPGNASPAFEWLDSGEAFDLDDWGGGAGTLQLRRA